MESRIAPLYEHGRDHLGIKGRKSGRSRSKIPAIIGRKGVKTKLNIADHPGTITGFLFEFPGILLGRGPGGDIAGKVQVAEIVPDFKDRLRRLGFPIRWTIGNGVSAENYSRALAKIGHSFAVAELGLNGFQPLLLEAIREGKADHLPWLVGSEIGSAGRSRNEHEVGFADLHSEFVVVRVRLFGNCGLAAHYVVAGRRMT